ncbi:hypothetical protein BH10PLA2_BH10PLA2_03610 [soil metagenome]
MRNTKFSIGLVALLWVGPAFADEIRGTLLRLSPDKQEVVVDVRERRRTISYTFRLDGETQVMLGQKPGKFADLTVGRRVRVLFEMQNGQPIARSIIGPGQLTLNPALLETIGNIAANNGLNIGNLNLGGMKNNPPAAVVPPQPIPAAPAGQNAVSGMMRRVSRTDREIVLLGDPTPGKPPSEVTVFVPNEAQITRDQQAIQFDDLKEGEPAVIMALPKNGRLEAQAVIIGQPPAGGIPAAPAPQAIPGAPIPQAIPGGAPPMQGESKITKIRDALRLLDGILQQFDPQSPQRP